MLTNIVLGTIIIILIISTAISARLIATLEAIYIRIKSIQEMLKDFETCKTLRDLRDDLKHYGPIPCNEEVDKVVEENYYAKTTVELPTEFEKLGQAIAKGIVKEEVIVESEAIKRFNSMTDNGKRVKRGQGRTIQELRSIIANIIKDKKERMNTSAALFKKYGMNKTTFYKYATQEQAEEMIALQKQLCKERMGQPRLRG